MQCGENKIEKLQLGRFIKSATAKAWNISRELNKGIKTARIEETTIAPQKKITYSPSTQGSVSTSLKFFERKPSKISEAERLGFGRRFNPQSGEDLHQFYSLQDRRQTMRDALKKIEGYNVFKEKDYLKNAKPNGYRSYHMILRSSDGFYIEIQLRTISMDTWAALEHHMRYKKDLTCDAELVSSELKRCAAELASTDVSMQAIKNLIFEEGGYT